MASRSLILRHGDDEHRVTVTGAHEVEIDGRRLIMLGSNNYLGLTTHPKVREAAARALEMHGPSMTGSRLMNGTSALHIELEQALARFVRKEAALVFTTGYQTNIGVLSALVRRGSAVVLDKLSHASLHDAARLSAVELAPFRACRGRIPMIMTAHVVYPALEDGVPATLSRRVVHGLLRRELGYDGVIVSDDLEMRATAFRATRPAATMTEGFDVLVQLVMAAITTEP